MCFLQESGWLDLGWVRRVHAEVFDGFVYDTDRSLEGTHCSVVVGVFVALEHHKLHESKRSRSLNVFRPACLRGYK
jgi:hypothetical protein